MNQKTFDAQIILWAFEDAQRIRRAARKRLWQLRLESAIITVNKAVATAAAFLF